MTVLHAGGKFDKDTYKVSGGLHGVGVSCVNALSIDLRVEVHRDGEIFEQEYSKGIPLYPVRQIGESDKNGTNVTFLPDPEIFEELVYEYDVLAKRARELSYLNKGMTIVMVDERQKNEDGEFRTETFHSEGGLKEFVKHLDKARPSIIAEPIHVIGRDDKENVE